MKILDTFTIKGRGPAIIVQLDARMAVGTTLRRVSDGAEWEVRGIERTTRVPTTGESAALLLSGGAEPAAGDELERAAPP